MTGPGRAKDHPNPSGHLARVKDCPTVKCPAHIEALMEEIAEHLPGLTALSGLTFGTGLEPSYEHLERAERLLDRAREEKRATCVHLLKRDVARITAETDIHKLREELIQLSAFLVQWTECIDRRNET
jgi:hypothetical protein